MAQAGGEGSRQHNRHHRRLCCVAIVVGLLPRPAALHARDLDASLQLAPGATCLRRGELLAQAKRWLAGDELDDSLSIVVAGDEKFSRFVSVYIARAGRRVAERRFEPGPSRCDDLHAAVGLAIAMACKAELARPASMTDAQNEDERERAGGPRRTAIGLGLVGGALVTPGVQAGLSVWVDQPLVGWLGVRVTALGLWSPTRGLVDGEAGEFDVQMLLGGAQLCATLTRLATTEFATCLGPAAGVMRVAGHRVAFARSQLQPRYAVLGTLNLATRVWTSVQLQASLGAVVPFQRTALVVRDMDQAIVAHQAFPAAGVLLMLGLSYAL